MDRKKSFDVATAARNSTLSGIKDRSMLNPYQEFSRTDVKQSLEDFTIK